MGKIITWVDHEGRYQVTSPAYNDPSRPMGETERECLDRVWGRIVADGWFGIPIDHPHFYVEDVDQRARIAEIGGLYFRKAGGWEMDDDGRPKVNMAKARDIQMDNIRIARDKQLADLDVTFVQAVETGDDRLKNQIVDQKKALRDIPQRFDLSPARDPAALALLWPAELEYEPG